MRGGWASVGPEVGPETGLGATALNTFARNNLI